MTELKIEQLSDRAVAKLIRLAKQRLAETIPSDRTETTTLLSVLVALGREIDRRRAA